MKPNVLLILTDQERAPTAEESTALRAFRRTQMVAHERLMERGVTLYDLDADPTERANLATSADHRAVRDAMERELTQQRTRLQRAPSS